MLFRSCAKRLGGIAVTTLPGVSRSFNPALAVGVEQSAFESKRRLICYIL